MNAQEFNERNEKALRAAELSKLAPIDFATMEAEIKKWMLVPDEGFIKFLCALYCANKLARRAIWAMVIGPSGGGKTEILNAFTELPDIYPMSMLTPSTFLSGMPGPKDASLLPKLNGQIMMFKDFTTVISMQRDARAEIFSQFREIYDGSMTKDFGTGKSRKWEGKVGLIAACTQAFDLSQQGFTHLGERFVSYRPLMPERKEVSMRSLENDHSQEEMSKAMKNAVFAFFKGIELSKHDYPELDHETMVEMVNLANFVTMARSGVLRDVGMKKSVIFVPVPEMPTRIAQQLSTIGSGLMMVNKDPVLHDADKRILYKVALDSIPSTNKMVIREMARGNEQTTSEIATALNYPTDPIRIYLENLNMLGVCRRIKSSGTSDSWTLHEEFSDILRHYEDVIELSDEEIAARKADDLPEDQVEQRWDEMGKE